MKDTYLKIKEVAGILRVNPKWVYTHKEKIPGFFRLEGVIFFDREILETSLKEKAYKPVKETKGAIPANRHGLP